MMDDVNHLSPNQWRARARSLAKKLKAERLLIKKMEQQWKEMEQRWKDERTSCRHFANQILGIRDLVCKSLGIKAPLFADDAALVKQLIDSRKS